MDEKNHINPEYDRLLHDQRERLKELACINQTTQVIKEGKSVEETLQQIVLLLPEAWQYPEFTSARIKFRDNKFETPDYQDTSWKMVQEFNTIDDEKGSIEV
jgi:hypothetical protein